MGVPGPESGPDRRVGPPGTDAGDSGDAGGLSGQRDLQAVLGQVLGHTPPPLDDDDAALQVGVQVEVVQLDGAAQPVGVDVDEIRARRPATGAPGR